MSTLLIGLIVVMVSGVGVGVLLFGHTRMPVLKASANEATVPSATIGHGAGAKTNQGDPLRISLLVRCRSAFLLVLLSLGIASAVASVFGVGIFALSFLLD